jgi:uncharacterized protein YbbC (DUF1343 family)
VNIFFGSEVLLDRPEGSSFRARLAGKRVALLAHPASVDQQLLPVWERIGEIPEVTLSALIGPQHGFAGEKQDNMVESHDGRHDSLEIPIFSLYGETRRLRPEWLDQFDVLIVDLQDVGVRVYTFLTTLGYVIEDVANAGYKELWVLDRPNPAGRVVEGLLLQNGWESFVGIAQIPMRHGLTLGEFALWYRAFRELDMQLTVVPMSHWDPSKPWPLDRVWVLPSPNMPALSTARAYPGTVLLEGTTLSEARGTTRPLSMLGHPDVNWTAVRRKLETGAPNLLHGCVLRDVAFQPTFHKHAGKVCRGFEIVAEDPVYDPTRFRPYRLVAHILKAVHELQPELPLWTEPPYEYEFDHLPIDVITGGPRLREWIESPQADTQDLEALLSTEEQHWIEEAAAWYLY